MSVNYLDDLQFIKLFLIDNSFNSSIISDQANALSAGITTQRDGLTRINNALDTATISTPV